MKSTKQSAKLKRCWVSLTNSHLIFQFNFSITLNSEQSVAENTEMQNVQMQIKDLSEELATLEASFNSIVGEETQRQRYEDVTTDSKLRIEFADTRSMY